MTKYFLALIGILCLLPMVASAAFNDVQFTADTAINLTAQTLYVQIGSKVEKMTVYPTNVIFDLLSGSIVTVYSNSKSVFTITPAIANYVCGENISYVTLSTNSATTLPVTVTPGAACTTPPGGGAPPSAPPAAPPAAPPTVPGEGAITPTAGGTVSATTTEGGGATVNIPVNAVVANTTVTVTPTATTAAAVSAAVAAAPSGQSIAGGYVYSFAATSAGAAVTTFAAAVTLTFTYTDTQIAGLNESTLTVYRWNTTTSQWVALPSTVNTATNTITATTTQFSYFSLLGQKVVTPAALTAAELKAQMIELIKQIMALIAQLVVQLQAQLAAM